MKLEERAILQERVKNLVLGQAMHMALARLADADRAAGRDARSDLSAFEETILTAARTLADKAVAQKLAVLVAVEDVSATLKAAFDGARAQIDVARAAESAATAIAA